jgi:hypothetical protein
VAASRHAVAPVRRRHPHRRRAGLRRRRRARGAIYTTLPAGTILATSELSLNFLRPPDLNAGDILVRASLIQAGRSVGLSQAAVEDASGRLLGHATSRCVLRPLGVPDAPPPGGPIPWPSYDGPNPFERPAEGQVLPPDVWERMSGLDMMRGWLRRELPWAPLSTLIGSEPLEAEEGGFACSIPASRWFCRSTSCAPSRPTAAPGGSGLGGPSRSDHRRGHRRGSDRRGEDRRPGHRVGDDPPRPAMADGGHADRRGRPQGRGLRDGPLRWSRPGVAPGPRR